MKEYKYIHGSFSRTRRSRNPLICTGSMPWLNDSLTPLGFLDHINFIFRGMSQVAFINNPVSGLLITLALAFQHPILCLMGLWGCISTTLFAVRADCSLVAIRNGAIGFSGALIGFALSLLMMRFESPNLGLWLLITVVLSYLNISIIKHLGPWFIRKTGLPYFTLPYNISVFVFIAFLGFLYPEVLNSSANFLDQTMSLNGLAVLESTIKTFGQVFFVGDLLTAAIICLAVGYCSLIALLLALLGALVFVAVALMYGFDSQVIYEGIVGYNTVLTAIVVGGVMYTSTLKTTLISIIVAVGSALLTIAIANILLPWGIPVLTLPFCLASIFSLFLIRTMMPGHFFKARCDFSTPEENLKLHRLGRVF